MVSIFDIDNWREIGATLSRNKTRTFLTAFGIFWGTLMLALLWGGANYFKALLYSNFEGFASNSAVVFSDRTTMPYKGFKKGMYWELTVTDMNNLKTAIPELEAVIPTVQRSANIKYKDRSYSGTAFGTNPDYAKGMTPKIISGRFINETDVKNDAKVCAIGEEAANQLFRGEDPLGKFVEVDNIFYHIIGVIKQESAINIGADLSRSMVIPETTMRRTYNLGDQISFMMLVVKNGYLPADIKDKVNRVIRSQHPIHPDDENALFFMDISEEFKQLNNIFSGVEWLIFFVGFSSLLAGIIGVGNIMWIVVKERTKEFGVRRAIGARPRDMMQQIMCESALLTLVAGMAAICFAVLIFAIVGAILSQSPKMPKDIPMQLSFGAAMAILSLFLVLGGAAGLIPALKAMKIKPIEALNDK